MEVKFELRSSGFIFALLEKSISTEARAAAKGMRLFEDNLGGVFDLPRRRFFIEGFTLVYKI